MKHSIEKGQSFFIALYEKSVLVATDDGQIFSDQRAALSKAHEVIRDVVCADILVGKPINLAHYVTIETRDGDEVQRIYFRDVVTFTDNADSDVLNQSAVSTTGMGER